MKFMLIFASAVALAIASPQRSLVNPGPGGPAPVDYEPIAVGPIGVEYEPIAVGPIPVAPEPIIPAPAPADPELIIPGPAPAPADPELIIPGPAPAPADPELIIPGPAPAPTDPELIIPGPAPAPAEPELIIPGPAPAPVASDNILIQLILNVNGHRVSLPDLVAPQPPIEVAPVYPVHVVEYAPEPVHVGPTLVQEPVVIGVPMLPHEAIDMPEDLN